MENEAAARVKTAAETLLVVHKGGAHLKKQGESGLPLPTRARRIIMLEINESPRIASEQYMSNILGMNIDLM